MALNVSLCPCDSGRPYFGCCGRWHAGALHLQAPDAQTLMRSRYSAFALDLTDYLRDTWYPGTRPVNIEPNPPGLKWLGLTVKAHQRQDGTHATVEFVARSRWQGKGERLHETSRFVLEDGSWFYVDGDIHEK